MKRSTLSRRTGLRRSAPGRAATLKRRTASRTSTEAERLWKAPQAGFCEACHRPCWHLQRHHVCYRQRVHLEGGDEWALSNSMLVCERCHAAHHSGFARISFGRVPDAAVDFTRRLLGEDRAALYFARYYGSPGGGETA